MLLLVWSRLVQAPAALLQLLRRECWHHQEKMTLQVMVDVCSCRPWHWSLQYWMGCSMPGGGLACQ